MAKTISTHNGTAAHREHNVRNPKVTGKQEHIDPALKDRNETLHDEKPREAYRRIFGEALAEYNKKQTREDRKIADYFTHVAKDKKKNPVYEMIVQIGDRNDTGIDAPVERECLKEFYAGWKERNPHLECIGAYLHADEADGTLHMHIDYVPVATGYKKGMEVQNGLNKALEQQGFTTDGKKTAQIQWEARENAALEAICERHGIEVIHPMAEKREHMSTTEYKAWQSTELARETKEALQKEADELQEALTSVRSEIDSLTLTRADKRQELLNASQMLKNTHQELRTLQEEVSTLQTEKTSLEGEIERLKEGEAQGERLVAGYVRTVQEESPKVQALIEQKKELEKELPALEAQISDAKEELEVVTAAVKEKKAEGERQMGSADLTAAVQAERERRQKEARVSLLEQFIQHPSIKPLWENFLRIIERDRKPKKRSSQLER